MSGRQEVVERLVRGALTGITVIADETHATDDEIMSAYFTLIRRGVAAAQIVSRDKPATCRALRDSLYTVLADVADQRLN